VLVVIRGGGGGGVVWLWRYDSVVVGDFFWRL